MILGDDLSQVNRKSIAKSVYNIIWIIIAITCIYLSGLKTLQLPDGCYTGAKSGTENDMRFLFIAANICYFLNDWSGMDVQKAVDFILKSIVSLQYG